MFCKHFLSYYSITEYDQLHEEIAKELELYIKERINMKTYIYAGECPKKRIGGWNGNGGSTDISLFGK